MKKNVFDFSGGYNDTVYNLNLKDNEFSEFYNVDPLPQGGFKVRNGCKKLNKVAFPGTITQMIEWKLRNGATKTIVISNRKIYVFSSVLGEWELVKNKDGEITLENDTVSYTFFRDYLYFCDGLKMYRWNDEVFYLSNLDEYEHRFKEGDIIKLTASNQESLFRGSAGTLMDVRNLMRPKFTYAYKRYPNEVDSYVFQDVYKLKYKFINIPSGTYESSENDLYNEPNGIYVLHYSKFENEGHLYDAVDGHFRDFRNEEYPFYGSVRCAENEPLNAGREHEIKFVESADGWGKNAYIRGTVDFHHVGNVGEYYQFMSDATEFYPHNYDYRNNQAYYGKAAWLKKLEEDELVENISEVLEFPVKVAACKYFCFYSKRQRFLASGNPEDPTAIYVSKLGTFEEWDDFVTIYPDCHLGAVTGIHPMNDDIVVCFENGFSYLDSELLLGGNEAVVEYIPRISSVPVGVSNGDTFCVTPQGVVFYHGENIYLASFSLFGKNYVKMPSQNEFICLSQNKCENILKGSTKHRAVYHHHKYYLYFMDAETKDRVLIYDFVYDNFRLYGDVGISGFISKEKDNMLLISCQNNVLAAFSDGIYLDELNGSTQPIAFAVRSKYYDIGYDFRRLQLNRLYLVKNLYNQQEETRVLVSLLGDSTEKEIKDTLSDGVLWKNSSWDAKYSWNQDFVIHAFNLNFRTNRIGFYITNCEEDVINSPIVFYSLSFHYDKLGEDTTKFRQELECENEPVFLQWPQDR